CWDALAPASSYQRAATSNQLSSRGRARHSMSATRKMTQTRVALITQNMHTALITNSSRYVSHDENTTPQAVSASNAWLTHGALANRSVVPMNATTNSSRD